MLTSLVDSQGKVIDRLAKLAAITQGLVETVGHLGEGVEVVLQASPPAEEGEPGNESQAEAAGDVVGVVVIDETDNGGGEAEDGEGEEE